MNISATTGESGVSMGVPVVFTIPFAFEERLSGTEIFIFYPPFCFR